MGSRLSCAAGLIRAVHWDLLWIWFLCCPSELGAKDGTGGECAASAYGRQEELFEMFQLNKCSVSSQKIMVRTVVTVFVQLTPTLEDNLGVQTEDNGHPKERSPVACGPCQIC